eukprot:jgi/Hompol1/6934/HPOL_001689-RA
MAKLLRTLLMALDEADPDHGGDADKRQFADHEHFYALLGITAPSAVVNRTIPFVEVSAIERICTAVQNLISVNEPSNILVLDTGLVLSSIERIYDVLERSQISPKHKLAASCRSLLTVQANQLLLTTLSWFRPSTTPKKIQTLLRKALILSAGHSRISAYKAAKHALAGGLLSLEDTNHIASSVIKDMELWQELVTESSDDASARKQRQSVLAIGSTGSTAIDIQAQVVVSGLQAISVPGIPVLDGQALSSMLVTLMSHGSLERICETNQAASLAVQTQLIDSMAMFMINSDVSAIHRQFPIFARILVRSLHHSELQFQLHDDTPQNHSSDCTTNTH